LRNIVKTRFGAYGLIYRRRRQITFTLARGAS
jgi:hypothetical protein